MKHGQFLSTVGQLNLLANEVMIEMIEELVGQTRLQVQPENVVVARLKTPEISMRDGLGLGSAEERLAARSDGEALHVVGAEVMQESGGVLAGDFDLAARQKIEDCRVFAGTAVFLFVRHDERFLQDFRSLKTSEVYSRS